jgi:hypothetical protein
MAIFWKSCNAWWDVRTIDLMLNLLLVVGIAGDLRAATIDEFNEWAEKRDVAAIEGAADPSLAGKFAFLRGQGAFGVGRYGWKASEIKEFVGGRRFVVFHTALTSQDYGDQVFEWDGRTLTRLVHERDTRGVLVRDLNMKLGFETSEKRVDVQATVKFENVAGAKDAFFVRLANNYEVKAVFDDRGGPVPFRQGGGVVSLPVGEGREFSYSMVYSGIVNRPRFAGAIVDGEVMLTNDYWWPSIGRLPATLTTQSRVPSDWVVVGQGDLVASVDDGAGMKTVTYRNDVPVSYFSYSAGDFKSSERTVDGIRYFVVSRVLSDQDRADQLEFVVPVLKFFGSLSPHPYREYGAVDTPLYGGGALEAYSYATYGTGWLPDEDPHEPSHTWWGGVIPNTYLDSFWNESFAVYSEGLYAREGSIGDRAARRRAFVDPSVASPAYQRGLVATAGAETGGLASTLGYGKGGVVLQQLELEMGTSAMIGTLKAWLAQHPVGTAGDWGDYERICGPQWKWFFDQWIRRTGWPTVAIDGPVVDGEDLVLTVRQEGAPYRFKLEIGVEEEDWREEYVDVIPDKAGVAVVRIAGAGDAKRVSIDPFDRLLQPRRERLGYRWNESARRMRVFDPAGLVDAEQKLDALTDDLNGVLIVGDPSQVPASAALWRQAGFVFENGRVSLDGVSVELASGGAVGIVQIGPEKFVGLRCGNIRHDPKMGIASVGLVDELGRFLTGRTLPRTVGPWVFEVGG